ncbi:MAG: sulfurtransferase [Gammaproteobacteria bacterium]|jgi:rhodanese-related sulfurtransferase|nr:sulfurtransferase [Gammaproteobacteria bacterium]NNJ48829.1 sulfurtransferase [Gammaproteobacteria bacterium]
MREFSAQELKAHLETCDEQPLLLDVRQPWEYEVCKIENSVLLPMSQITAEYNSLDFDRETVVICHHGIRSRRVGRYLEQAGFSNIINLSGGVAQWAQTVDKDMPTY